MNKEESRRKNREKQRRFWKKHRVRLIFEDRTSRRNAASFAADYHVGQHVVFVDSAGEVRWAKAEAMPEGSRVLLKRMPRLASRSIAEALRQLIRQPRRNGHLTPVVRISPDGTKEEFATVTDASRSSGISRTTIHRCISAENVGRTDCNGCRWLRAYTNN